MNQPEVIATRLLKLEQQIIAYQKLHDDEYSELWLELNTIKKDISAYYEEIDDQTNLVDKKERKEEKPNNIDPQKT